MLQDTFYFNGIIFFVMANVIIIGGAIIEYKKQSDKKNEVKLLKREIIAMVDSAGNDEMTRKAKNIFSEVNDISELKRRKSELTTIIRNGDIK